jgi:hypothetical protein
MKLEQLLTIVAAGCMLAVFVPVSAQAQRAPLPEIIQDFCREVALDSDHADRRLDDADQDAANCPGEFDDCQERIFNDDVVSCLVDFADCTSDANEDEAEVCGEFSEELEDAYDHALREARREGPGVERRFQEFIDNRSDQCLQPARNIVFRCATLSSK